jgi:hypothetical protein
MKLANFLEHMGLDSKSLIIPYYNLDKYFLDVLFGNGIVKRKFTGQGSIFGGQMLLIDIAKVFLQSIYKLEANPYS